eukprot:TRINITY_DN7447_c1_g2_i1.p1 TRINITY_DN7447_c1_g2~~TRINITY_DN7447_c1_g2_i1.p1  ORF type:complete len:135 (-),score=17.51 TRINITY_DN7447_c1_g2_i1:809-1213(-)
MQCMQMSESLSYTKFAGSPIMSLHLSSTKENIAVTMTSSTYFSEGKSKSSSDVVFASPWSSYLFSIQPSFHYICIHTLFSKSIPGSTGAPHNFFMEPSQLQLFLISLMHDPACWLQKESHGSVPCFCIGCCSMA